MDALKSAGRALLRSPSVHKPAWAGGRHKKLPENWTDTRETLLEGMLFSLKYMGMTLVEQPKGEELSAAAVKRIVATAKASGKKLQKVTLKVSPRGIVLNDSGTNELIENVSIYRISYCTADKIHDKVFAYIAQNQLNENLECHAFLCTKRKMAQAVTLTVAQAFKIAFEFWQAAKEEKEKRERSILEGEGPSSPSSEAPARPDTPAATGNLLDLEDPAKSALTSSMNPLHLDNSMFGPSSSVNNNVVWEMDDGLDEAFSSRRSETSTEVCVRQKSLSRAVLVGRRCAWTPACGKGFAALNGGRRILQRKSRAVMQHRQRGAVISKRLVSEFPSQGAGKHRQQRSLPSLKEENSPRAECPTILTANRSSTFCLGCS